MRRAALELRWSIGFALFLACLLCAFLHKRGEVSASFLLTLAAVSAWDGARVVRAQGSARRA
jgi:membrane protease YdiL (CAAX protease family)